MVYDTTETSVRRTVHVPVPPDRAFELFTSRMAAFWPPDHHIASAELADVVIEGWPGGCWYERGVDGSECPWGRVAIWQPPDQLVLIWQINGEWRFDPGFATEVDVTFTEHVPGHTRVELEHRDLDRYGEDIGVIRACLGSPNGWGGILARYVTAASEPSEQPILRLYTRSLDQFARVLGRMPGGTWDTWSPCTEWTARDVVGHTIWGEHLIHAWVAGAEPPSYRYVPGGERPGPLAGDDPVDTWHAARATCASVLDRHALDIEVESRAVGTTTVGERLELLTVDNTTHAWDLGTTAGLDVHLDGELVDNAVQWVTRNGSFIRESGQFGEQLTPPASCGAQTRLLAALGRRGW